MNYSSICSTAVKSPGHGLPNQISLNHYNMNMFGLQVFGDMAMSGLDKEMSTAVSEGAKNMEKVLGSRNELNKVGR